MVFNFLVVFFTSVGIEAEYMALERHKSNRAEYRALERHKSNRTEYMALERHKSNRTEYRALLRLLNHFSHKTSLQFHLKYSAARKRIYFDSMTKIGSFIMPIKKSSFMLATKQEPWKCFLRRWAFWRRGCEEIGEDPGFCRNVDDICALLGYYMA